ncbi:diguanylate cyclase response regulator [Halomicronema hongdechloris C2206]|uniref:Diguanylate cyclase response regulator n=2 Tax=Halomicronema hongdechloris TaxID=1209493 RepID=A0A1Z3HPA4_9CYAN|nr:diguanylate cyclase response regulator [Halomicronema hongdechloris C2206]
MPFQAESFLILLVEDDRLTRTMLRQALTQEGYRVIEASDGEECLSVYGRQQPNLVLLDAMMPTMNGFDCCAKLLTLPGAAQTPIIMITGLEDKASVDWAFDLGATDYVTKPIHWPILRRRVRNLLEKEYFYRELALVNQKLHQLAITDQLTNLANRRYFDDCFEREWRRSLRYQTSLSLILCDVDYFKAYNDIYGHQAGDACLQRVAQVLSHAAKRATDIVARYGGEEFAIILPDTRLDGAMGIAQAIRAELKILALPHPNSVSSHVTISQGVASTVPTRDIAAAVLIEGSDQALYQAKRNGRDAIAAFSAGQLITPFDSHPPRHGS